MLTSGSLPEEKEFAEIAFREAFLTG